MLTNTSASTDAQLSRPFGMVFAYSEPGVTKSAEVTGAEGVAAAAEAAASIATARTLTSIADDLRTSERPSKEKYEKGT